jgi:predicted Rossmann fold nucleotide-binding protein DprA/Smf involved in DNA uptake
MRLRRVRKVTSYLCTACYKTFPTSQEAREHAQTHPAAPKAAQRRGRARGPGRPRTPQTTRILNAVKAGAHSAKEIQQQTRIPIERVHALLSYLRRKGKVKGFKDQLKATA